MKYWEIIADNLSKAGWSWGCVSGRGLSWANNLHCGRASRRRKAVVVRADEKLAPFVELRIGDSRSTLTSFLTEAERGEKLRAGQESNKDMQRVVQHPLR